jgi:hypothetical protein
LKGTIVIQLEEELSCGSPPGDEADERAAALARRAGALRDLLPI